MIEDRFRFALGAVVDRWYKARLLRFNSHDDGSDDLLLRDELVRAALEAATSEPLPHPGENHEFRTTCLRCGESGYLNISLIGPDQEIRIETIATPTEPTR